MDNNLLVVNHLNTVIHSAKGDLKACDDVSFVIPRGSIIGLVGESGCGKSMCAKSIIRLLKNNIAIESGEVLLESRDLTKLSETQMCSVRGEEISMIFQEPMTSLNPVATVGSQVLEAVMLHRKISKTQAKDKVLKVFADVGIPDPEKRYNCYPHELSGGLRQRVMIAMAMVCRPKLLLCDEPTTALDVTVEAQILELLKQLRDLYGTSIIMISHNLGVIAQLCDYVYVMYAGKIVEHGDVFELFDHPAHPYTKGLLKAINALDKDDEILDTIPGQVPQIENMPTGCRFNPRCDKCMDKCSKFMPELKQISKDHYSRCYLDGEGNDE